MLIAGIRKAGIVASLCVLAISLGACGPSDGGSSDKNKGGGRANVDANDGSNPRGAAGTSTTRDVVSENMPYAELGDELVYGYFVAPADMFEPLPAVIMIHEWWGLNDNIRVMADRLAAEGFIVLAVDLYGGKVAKNSAEARQLMLSVVEDMESANDNIRRAFDFVSATAGAPRVGSIGWRFGGTWSLNAAMLFPDELDATVIYYAQVTDDEDKLRPIESPILGLFAAKDISMKVKSVDAFGAALERLRKDYEIHIYPGVSQTFADPTSDKYDEATAADAWRRTLEFLDRYLTVDDS